MTQLASSLPPAPLIRAVLDGEKPYETPSYGPMLGDLCSASVLKCCDCGYEVDRADLPAFRQHLAAGEAKNAGASDAELHQDGPEAGYGFFRAAARAPSYAVSAGNLDLVCLPCFHARHLFLPSFKVIGFPGLVPEMSQTEAILVWRYTMLAGRSDAMRAATMRGIWVGAQAEARSALTRAVGAPSADAPVNDVAYWLSTAPELVYDMASTFLPDLVLLPPQQWDAYGPHLDYALFKNMLGLPSATKPAAEENPRPAAAEAPQ